LKVVKNLVSLDIGEDLGKEEVLSLVSLKAQ
jgi:hypothetical protein